jgi:enterochelin esterase-like enzyme
MPITSLLLLSLTAPIASDGPAAPPTVASGHVERFADFPSAQVPPRNVDVWLPDGYPRQAPYDVLYMHDGQMLFDAAATWNHQEWRVDEVAGELIASGRVRPFIVVGVWNGGAARHPEYFPQKPFDSLPEAVQQAQLALARDSGQTVLPQRPYADRYLRFLVDELRPAIERRFEVATGPGHTFVMGSSMGGLISMYALAEHPAVFGGAACLSTHWPGGFQREDNPHPAAFLAYIESTFPKAGTHRIWFDHGTATLDAMYPALQREVDARIAAKGYGKDDWVTRVYEGAEHSEQAWAARLADPLVFLLGTRPDPPAPPP